MHKTDLYRRHLRHLPETVQQQYLRDIRTPFMAEATAREQVDGEGVVYRLADREVKVQFIEGNYQFVG